MQLGDLDNAMSCFDEAIKLDINDKEAYMNKGLALLAKNEPKDVVFSCIDRALEIDDLFVEGWINKGHVHWKLRNYNNAIECFEKAIQIDPKNDEA